MQSSNNLPRNVLCLFNSTRKWGGGEQWHLSISDYFVKKNCNVFLFARKNGDLFAKASLISGLPIIPVKIRSLSFLNIFKVLRLAILFKKLRVYTIVLNLPSDAKAGGLAAKLAGVKHIIYRRGSAIPIKNSLINRLLFRYIITGVIANSQETKRTILLKNKNLIKEHKITVIYNGINITETKINLTNSVNNCLIIGNAGRLEKQKAQKHLIDLAVILQNRNLNFEIRIAGQGTLKSMLEAYALEKNVQSVVKFTGFTNDMPQFLSELDIFVLTSEWEGFGYVIAEAGASSLPVLAFNVSSNPELIIDNQTGFLISPFDLNALANKIDYLYNNPSEVVRMGENARNFVLSNFNQPQIFNQLSSYFSALE